MTNSSSRLATAFYFLGLLAILVYLASTGVAVASEMMAAARIGSGLGVLSMSSYTNTETAKITLTNRTGATAWACMKGVVSSTATGTKVESHVVCTGEVKPRSTVVIEAPYRVGAVLEVCNKTGFGDVKVVDWSKCSFDVVDMTQTNR